MDIFRVEYSKLDDIGNTAVKAAKRLESRISDNENIINRLQNVSGSNRTYISSAVSSIKRKNSSMEEKANALRSFAQRCEDYAEHAQQVDRTVANRINRETDQFKKVNNIKIGFVDKIKAGVEQWIRDYFGRAGSLGREAYAWLTEKGRNIKNEIRSWYHEGGGKYLIEIVKDVGLAILAVASMFAAGGILGVLIAGFTLYDSIMATAFDVCAFAAYKGGVNKASAERLSEMDGREAAVASAVSAAETMGADGETAAKLVNNIYTILEVTSFVYGTYQGVTGIVKGFKSFKEASGGSFKITDFKKNLKTFNDMEKMNKVFTTINTNGSGTMKLIPRLITNMDDGPGKLSLIKMNAINNFPKNIKKFNPSKLIDTFTSHGDVSNYYDAQFEILNSVPKLGETNFSPLATGTIHYVSGAGGGGMGGRGGTTVVSMMDITKLYMSSVSGGR